MCVGISKYYNQSSVLDKLGNKRLLIVKISKRSYPLKAGRALMHEPKQGSYYWDDDELWVLSR